MDTWRQVASVLTCLLQKQPWQNTFIYTWHGKSNIYKEALKSICMSVEEPLPPKWKLTNTWIFKLGEKQFSCEQWENECTQKLILHQHKIYLTREKRYTCPCGKLKIQYLGNFSQKGYAFNSYIEFSFTVLFFCFVLILYFLTHYILQDVTANTELKPCKC